MTQDEMIQTLRDTREGIAQASETIRVLESAVERLRKFACWVRDADEEELLGESWGRAVELVGEEDDAQPGMEVARG